MGQGQQSEVGQPVTLTAIATSADPADILRALADQLAQSIRVCVEAGQITEEQAREIRGKVSA